MKKLLAGLLLTLLATESHAGIIKLSVTDFAASAGQITFSEFALGTTNPFYSPTDYGGSAGAPDVSFAGWFTGQSLSGNAGVDCPGAAATACIIGTPTGPLSLDLASQLTQIVGDGANPTSPVLSGSPTFNGGIAVLFSVDQFGVGFDGGFFDAIGSTAITAFDRNGNLIGSVINTVTGIEFLGLATSDGQAAIAGVFLDLVGNEPAGFAIDNIRFGQAADIRVDIPSVPEPSALALLVIGLAGVAARRKAKH